MLAAQQLHLRLNIPANVIHSYYEGGIREIVASAIDGRVVRFPANILRPFVTHDGVHGEFALEFDANHKFVAIHRLA
jgi:hypothetical protein